MMISQISCSHLFIQTPTDPEASKSGVYCYSQSKKFQCTNILYTSNNDPVKSLLPFQYETEKLRGIFKDLMDTGIKKVSWNSQKDRITMSYVLRQRLDPEGWVDVSVLASMAGYPRTWKEFTRAYFGEEKVQSLENVREVYKELKELETDQELESFWMSERINDTGFYVDSELVDNVLTFWKDEQSRIKNEMQFITQLQNPNSIAQLKQWFNQHEGLTITNLNSEQIDQLLDRDDLTPDGRRVLGLRQQVGTTSISKFKTLKEMQCSDGRVRGTLVYHRASTGRYAGIGFQPQNIPQPPFPDLDNIRELIHDNDFETARLIYGDMADFLKSSLRPCIMAHPGNALIVSDYSSIECRVLNWLADEKWALEAFENGQDIYSLTAEKLLKKPATKESRKIGKVATLALGYGGGVNAFSRFGGSKLGLDENEIKRLVDEWRNNSRNVVQLWRQAENAFKNVVNGFERFAIAVGTEVTRKRGSRYTEVKLPSGRKLYYVDMEINKETNRLSYMKMDGVTHKWQRVETYGGKLVENIVQAVARDCLVEALKRCEQNNLQVVLHVHDEIVVEVSKENSKQKLELLNQLMTTPIPWAQGLKLDAEGFVSEYYKK